MLYIHTLNFNVDSFRYSSILSNVKLGGEVNQVDLPPCQSGWHCTVTDFVDAEILPPCAERGEC